MITKRIRVRIYNYAAAGCVCVSVLLTLRVHVQSKRTRVYTDIGFTLNCAPKVLGNLIKKIAFT